ncbi:hypothetical protein [Pilimelia columellifera]|uniref:SRPBCC family protein n=1 Tax=Pilimelia columellifera subsp. columellifera TaxID=706583 RepID=A0ABN3NRH1_9ACTN
MSESLYIETLVRVPMNEIWRLTQDPDQHQRWDLRFGSISALTGSAGGCRGFRYALTVWPGRVISGEGVTVSERWRSDGSCTSVLRFSSQDPLSLVSEGVGFWRYLPTAGGIRFLTRYRYEPRWGRLGRQVDRVFRPLLGWATAWSFDRLRLWVERGVGPRRGLFHGLAEVVARVSVVAGVVAVGPAGWAGPSLVAVVLMAAVLAPPTPYTPAARRCLRRPPDVVAARPPATASLLEEW